MTDENSFRIEVLLSFQRALGDMVTPNLRGVTVTIAHSIIKARFIYDGQVTQDERMIVAEVETYVIADFVPPVDVFFTAVPSAVGSPRELAPHEEWVYLRREQ